MRELGFFFGIAFNLTEQGLTCLHPDTDRIHDLSGCCHQRRRYNICRGAVTEFIMNRWEISILHIIASHAGTASLNHIYSEIPKYINLTNSHEKVKYNAPNYHHQTRAHIDDLLGRKDIIRVGRGIYSITPRGQSRIEKMKKGHHP